MGLLLASGDTFEGLNVQDLGPNPVEEPYVAYIRLHDPPETLDCRDYTDTIPVAT
jgi:hypothetical protein